jgi:hypothetical protein
MNARFLVPLIGLSWACAAETSFQNTDDGGDHNEGNGKVEWLPAELVFTDLQQAITVSQMLKLTSVGDNNLVVYEVRVLSSGGGVFYMGEDDIGDITLAPGTSREFPVTATMDEWVEEVVGSVRVKTNDPDAISFEIPCTATPTADWGAPDTGE